MNRKELQEFLNKFPEDMEIILEAYSDYALIKEDDFVISKAVDQNFYVMKVHPTMSEENKLKIKPYLIIESNITR